MREPAPAPSTTLAPGTPVGSYRVVRRLGEGGMGEVYEALNDEIHRRAAIKILHPEAAADPNVAARFQNEARAANLIDHPGIVQVFDTGRLDDGRPFIVMELLEGETLAARLRRGPVAQAAGLRAIRQVASALAAAHARGIIHRDLKPDNVFLVPDPETPGGERAKVLDFGIAKVAPSERGEAPRTRTDMVMGTPAYMAPEQCRGAGRVDQKADVYALGVMLFQVIADRLPFRGDDPVTVMYAHMKDPPPSLRVLRPAIAPTLAGLVEVMLAKEPAARPTMVEVVRALERLGAGQTGTVLPRAMEVSFAEAGGQAQAPEDAGLRTTARGVEREPVVDGVGQTMDELPRAMPDRVARGGASQVRSHAADPDGSSSTLGAAAPHAPIPAAIKPAPAAITPAAITPASATPTRAHLAARRVVPLAIAGGMVAALGVWWGSSRILGAQKELPEELPITVSPGPNGRRSVQPMGVMPVPPKPPAPPKVPAPFPAGGPKLTFHVPGGGTVTVPGPERPTVPVPPVQPSGDGEDTDEDEPAGLCPRISRLHLPLPIVRAVHCGPDSMVAALRGSARAACTSLIDWAPKNGWTVAERVELGPVLSFRMANAVENLQVVCTDLEGSRVTFKAE